MPESVTYWAYGINRPTATNLTTKSSNKFLPIITSASRSQEDLKWTTHWHITGIYAKKQTPGLASFRQIYAFAQKTDCMSLVHSISEYSAVVLDPHIQKDTNHFECQALCCLLQTRLQIPRLYHFQATRPQGLSGTKKKASMTHPCVQGNKWADLSCLSIW